ncbi:MAG: hypothetical protein A3E16_04335 [Candidatus Blackburnbacteria bacterium RIFCSPHIGHO2_12_FULL_44_25]|nr:MAG: hypothetical protein A3E16_04335 [Candidatus Blackburnbacteria bacterium RIFCSPHIGHO2_12_FULL_44_25]
MLCIFYRIFPESAFFTSGNLLFRSVFLRKWQKLLSRSILAIGMIFVRILEATGAITGFIYGSFLKKNNK